MFQSCSNEGTRWCRVKQSPGLWLVSFRGCNHHSTCHENTLSLTGTLGCDKSERCVKGELVAASKWDSPWSPELDDDVLTPELEPEYWCSKVWCAFPHFWHFWPNRHCCLKCPGLRQLKHMSPCFMMFIHCSHGKHWNFLHMNNGCCSCAGVVHVQMLQVELTLVVYVDFNCTLGLGWAGRFWVSWTNDSDAWAYKLRNFNSWSKRGVSVASWLCPCHSNMVNWSSFNSTSAVTNGPWVPCRSCTQIPT